MSRRLAGRLLLCALVVGAVSTTHAYLKLGVLTPSGVVALRWTRPIQYLVTNRDVDGVSAPQLQAAMSRAFSTWAAVPDVSFTHAFTGFSISEPFVADGLNVIGFRARPDLERTLAAATFEIDELTGRIIESDIFFNTAFPWSVATAGQAGRFDLESTALHELGHLLGLGHSGLGETELRLGGDRSVLGKRAVMFPIAYPTGNIEDRTPEADDRAGIADIYGGSSTANNTGTLAGRVTLGGVGVFGAHVTAFHTRTGDLVGGFSLNANGDFVIASLEPGLYVVRVEPLDDADVTSFFDKETVVNVNFKPVYFSKLVAVPRGGSGAQIAIQVVAK